MIRLPEHIAVVLIHHARSFNQARFSTFESDIGGILSTSYGIECPSGLIEDALAVLIETTGCKVLTSPLTGKYYTIDATKAEYYFGSYPSFSDFRGDEDLEAAEEYDADRQEIRQKYPVVDTYFQADSVWTERVIEALSELDISDQYFLDAPEPRAYEADETVELDQEHAKNVRAGLEELESQLRTSNEAGEIFGNDREIALAEVGALRSLFDRGRVRSGSAIELARRSLGWISEKAAGAAIGELAKRVLNLIIGLFT